ncbi:MAG: carboxymuconolactone decarboxylase family protein [Candidatus Heimdallarchaeota archaeon]
MRKKVKNNKNKKIDSNRTPILNKPRITPISEVDFVKELILFRNAMNQIEYPNREVVESEWESEMSSLVSWLKAVYTNILNDLTSVLNLEKNTLSVELINSGKFDDTIESFVKEKGTIYHIMATMMRYRRLRLKWLLIASHVTYDSLLPPRDKEILILRNAWLCGSEYEWDHHVLVGRQVGLTNEEIEQIKLGPEAQGWSNFDKKLLKAVDELYTNRDLTDSTWNLLSENYNTKQMMDLIFVVGAYNMLAMFMKSIGFETEECVKRSLND